MSHREIALIFLMLIGASDALATTVPPTPALDLPIEGAITQPDWVRRPTGAEFSDAYPLVPQVLSIKGDVKLSCEVASTGVLTNCVVAYESPMGMGFGAAALSLTTHFQMKPETIDGAPVSGAKIMIPIGFRMGGGDILPSVPTKYVVETPSPEAIALARRIVAASGQPLGLPMDEAAFMYSLDRNLKRREVRTEDAQTERAVLTAVSEALREAAPALLEARASAYAHSYPVAELRRIADFLESPAGRDWTANLQTVDELDTNGIGEVLQSVRSAAARAYCATRMACETSSTPGK